MRKDGLSSITGVPTFKSLGERLILSLFIFGLFREWLSPLLRLLGPDGERPLDLFHVLTILLLVAGCLSVPFAIFTIIPPLLCIGGLIYLYGGAEGIGWISDCIHIFMEDISGVLNTGRIAALSPEMRMFVLLLGWALLVVSVQMLALSRQSILLFFCATVIYLLSLELGLGLHTYWGLVRTVLIGLLLQAVLHTLHIQEESSDEEPGAVSPPNGRFRTAGFAAGITAVLGGIIGVATIVGSLPIQPAKPLSLQQAVASMEAWTQTELAASTRGHNNLSGYGNNDSDLGGPLTLNNKVFFTATSPYPTYYRGESKSTYTGRGWTQQDQETSPLSLDGRIPSEESVRSGGEELIQSITFKEPQTGRVVLVGGGIPVKVNRLTNGKQDLPFHNLMTFPDSGLIQYSNDTESQNIHASSAGSSHSPDELLGYEITVREQKESPDVLNRSKGEDPVSISSMYNELPDTLPKEVRDLGDKLTKGSRSRYEAVKSVQSYLKNNYKYSLDPKSLPSGQDFTANFLFVQKIGYCDHFSTAMAVLLRTQGIPARWVKGFASGQKSEEDPHQFTVSYSDAHSWVEVYFPGVGWVPFDPTPGFESAGAATPASLIVKDTSSYGNLVNQLGNAAFYSMRSALVVISEIEDWLPHPLLAVAALCLAGSIYLIVRALWPAISVWIRTIELPSSSGHRRFPQRDQLLLASDKAWKQLYGTYGPRPAGVTGREYIERIPGLDPTQRDHLNHFLHVWESLYYGAGDLDRMSTKSFLEQCRQVGACRG
ncbi:transglutaminase-like domain-containing protein [Paenibacillus sp. SN-8-1]|uniref:transglutaminase-like domain-containing protein n=1 Tax=Paenibacillus sp. SN-8-1 TaxID=3435409 RepID=UPI003D9AAFFE